MQRRIKGGGGVIWVTLPPLAYKCPFRNLENVYLKMLYNSICYFISKKNRVSRQIACLVSDSKCLGCFLSFGDPFYPESAPDIPD